ncbi:MAG: helix-turn-helix domain-containing protein [Phycisphaerae bacterium]|nr:helix-turn-helix domain-containing protein [Phycisphaerae bacterium]
MLSRAGLLRALWSVDRTYEQVAESAGISVETIYRALRGQPIRGRHAHALAAALSVELDAILKPEKSRRTKAVG